VPREALALSDPEADPDADLDGDPEALVELDSERLALGEALSDTEPAYALAESSAQVILAWRPSALNVKDRSPQLVTRANSSADSVFVYVSRLADSESE